ncbi:hypothetical protein MXMO3_00576 [Maritalea myrionectae]|uniref:Probable queuosine precursor transporter n=1 Tax=Maritalea myrionectae TaxID=454601 RepID=A0A2R4MAU3_9HYPH|nr:VUT family protein [Maritalea myrionectae]AVX03120.1 hypothetical protein MXMO3_00576 [Maritalea myrionectae]
MVLTRLLLAIVAMAVVVTASNFLVQFPVQAQLGPANLADILTWGAFTYPFAFLVTDLTNRFFGPQKARIVVLVGFALAVVLSIIFMATPRIAIASGTAFLTAQLLDVSIFDRLRKGVWWKAPLVSSGIASVVDTLLFFSLAMAPAFAFIDGWFGMDDSSLGLPVPFLSFGAETPLYLSLAVGDMLVKALMVIALLLPYQALRRVIAARVETVSA